MMKRKKKKEERVRKDVIGRGLKLLKEGGREWRRVEESKGAWNILDWSVKES